MIEVAKKYRSGFKLSAITAMLFVFMFFDLSVQSQDIEEFREFEDSLVSISYLMYNANNDEEKFNANETFIIILEDALSLKNSFRYPFDSLEHISIINAPDDMLRLFTWTIFRENGTYSNYGFIQSYSRRFNDYEVYFLNDMSGIMEAPEMKVLDHKNWYGAIYYDIILTKTGSSRYYTLLGWDGNDPLIQKKIIEVLTLRSNGMPRFGHSLFPDFSDASKRIIFQYSSLTTMNLRFEKQSYFIEKRRWFYNESRRNRIRHKKPGAITEWLMRKGIIDEDKHNERRNRKPYRKIKQTDEMIVFDNLIPKNPSLKGQYQFYVPEGNIVNALRFSDGKWRLEEDIDARNPEHIYDDPKKRPVPEGRSRTSY